MFKKSFKFFIIAVFVLALATTTYALAAANTVPTSTAGDGNGAISGYTVSAVHYALNAANPANIDTVTFTIAPAAPTGSVATIQLVAAGTWYPCTITMPAGTAVSCTTTGAPVSTATSLHVVIAQ
jgi:hypothetical protein